MIQTLATRFKLMICFQLVFPFFLLTPEVTSAYILEAPHILHLTVQKMGAPDTLSVLQNLTIHDPSYVGQSKTLQETLHYRLPEQYRSDIITDELTKIYVFSHYNAITIINEKISSTVEDLFEYYRDLLLLQNRTLLENRLAFFGVNIQVVSFGRFDNHHFYIIGAMYPDETVPQVWIEKETFLPARFLILDQSDPDREKIVEFRYANWTQTDRAWYPMRIETYVDNQLFRTVDVQSVALRSDYDNTFFDIEQLKSTYPPLTVDPYISDETDELDDVQQSIEDIKNRFE